MIILITGTPGAGKTLYGLVTTKVWSEKERRPVFYSGVRELVLPWTLFGRVSKDVDRPWDTDPSNWWERVEDNKPVVPDGAIIFVDECQRWLRPRPQGSAVPMSVSQLETHRHRGLDFVLITQHAGLIDSNVRKLVGRHLHVARVFGMGKATVFEWPVATDISPSTKADAVRHDFVYPKEAYGWYKSAEVHTVRRRLPMRIKLIPVIVLMIALGGYGAWSSVRDYFGGQAGSKLLANKAGPEEKSSSVSSGSRGSGGPIVTTKEYVASFIPRVTGLPFTAPAYDKVTELKRAPVPVACAMSVRRGCVCYSQQATMIETGKEMCEMIVSRGYFEAFDRGESRQEVGRGVGGDKGAEPVRGVPVAGAPVGGPLPGVAGTAPAGGKPRGVAGWDVRGYGAAEDLPSPAPGMFGGASK